jgi:hypothetical protein
LVPAHKSGLWFATQLNKTSVGFHQVPVQFANGVGMIAQFFVDIVDMFLKLLALFCAFAAFRATFRPAFGAPFPIAGWISRSAFRASFAIAGWISGPVAFGPTFGASVAIAGWHGWIVASAFWPWFFTWTG